MVPTAAVYVGVRCKNRTVKAVYINSRRIGNVKEQVTCLFVIL